MTYFNPHRCLILNVILIISVLAAFSNLITNPGNVKQWPTLQLDYFSNLAQGMNITSFIFPLENIGIDIGYRPN